MAVVFQVAMAKSTFDCGLPKFGVGSLGGIFPWDEGIAGLFAGDLVGDFTIDEGFE
jgi:hypothetical protein